MASNYAHDKFDAKIPTWVGRAEAFRTFAEDIEWFKEEVDLDQKFNVAARIISRQRGAVKLRGRQLKREDLRPRPTIYDPGNPEIILEPAEPLDKGINLVMAAWHSNVMGLGGSIVLA